VEVPFTDKWEESAIKLASDHWEYVKGCLINTPEGLKENLEKIIEYHYKTAFIHGFKHAKVQR
jgi:hypothetical protein